MVICAFYLKLIICSRYELLIYCEKLCENTGPQGQNNNIQV